MINQRPLLRDDDTLFAIQTLPDSVENFDALILACIRAAQSNDTVVVSKRSSEWFGRLFEGGRGKR
jgi:hypothetical protein